MRNFDIISLPKIGDVITTKVEIKEEVFGMTLASAIIKSNDKILATTDIKIAVKGMETEK